MTHIARKAITQRTPSMSRTLRSKQGCWTCRLRKKKCDERHPHCSTCESLSITCFGYGPKPDWMDNGEEARAVAAGIKEIVRQTSGRKATAQVSRRNVPVIKIAPKALNNDEQSSSCRSDSSLLQTSAATTASEDGPSQKDGIFMMQDESAGPPSSAPNDQIAGPLLSMPADESTLMMHFLDSIFLLQYPMYRPDIKSGGRGWLLNLLLGSKPFYHAALALSAYHRRTMGSLSSRSQVVSLVQQEQHLEIALNAMKASAKNSCQNNGLGVASTVVQLMFFELFTGDHNACLTHLRAAITMTQKVFEKKDFGRLGLAERAWNAVQDNLPVPEDEAAAAEQVANFRCLTGTTTWLDIISSVTRGTAPQLLPCHSRVIAPTSQTKLEDIMGCKNWVMLQIASIAALHERRIQAIGRGDFDCAQLQQSAFDITLNIQGGLTQAALEDFSVSEHKSTRMMDSMANEHTIVTCAFALMASTYLHLVIHGFQQMEMLDEAITKTMNIFQAEATRRLLPALVAPLYIMGAVARQEEKPFFREILSSLPLADPSLKHRERILPVLEQIWRQRERVRGLTWKDSLDFTQDILLV